MDKHSLRWTMALLICAGVALWLINWWSARPLFMDESNVARNLFDRSFTGMFQPLDHRQYAPPLYLVMAKACGEFFGYGQRSLRFPALLGGLLTVAGLVVGGKALRLGWWTLLPLGLLFLNPSVLRYVTEAKPYALDMGIAALFIAWAINHEAPGWRAMLGGVIGVWFSLPLIFVLAGIGLYRFAPLVLGLVQLPNGQEKEVARKNARGWVAAGAVWLLSFALLYFTVLAPSVGSKYLNIYHGQYFFPLPGSPDFLVNSGTLLLSFPKLAFGHTAFAQIMGVIVFGAFVLHRQYGWLILPLFLVCSASAFGYYSLIPRLLLFTLPSWWLMAALVSRRWSKKLPWAIPVLWLLVLGGTNVVKHYAKPQKFSDTKALVTIEAGYEPVLHHSAVPGWDYYHRIHPEGKGLPFPALENSIQQLPSPDKKVLLYDVLTQGNIRESVQRDSTWAAERGCKVRSVAMFRAKALYIDCP